jgi:5-methyltetrahydrofolate--homocysteine methyltransferase
MKPTFLDGALGTMLQSCGLKAGEVPEDWNLTHPEKVLDVQRRYAEAGADIISANTFGANALKYHGKYSVADVVAAAVKLAREAAGSGRRVAIDLGPTGRLLKPSGDLDLERAYEAFAETVKCGAAAGADLVLVETMGDTMELKAAVLAAKENCRLPVMATVALGEDGKLLTGADVECVATLLESLRIDACGFNCGIGPDLMLPYVQTLSRVVNVPIIVKPNAGLPIVKDGKTVFTVDPETFARHIVRLAEAGATIVGGCCGTTPAHIKAAKDALMGLTPLPPRVPVAKRTAVSSGTSTVELCRGEGLIIGERINPTGKRRLKEAYQKGDSAYILREAVAQADAGAQILDINCGVPGIDEATTLAATVEAVQSVSTLPVQIDTADPAALEAALRRVNGKALVNSVNGKRESMDAVFPLVKRYGGTIVALCLDENGIPDTPDGRIAIARKILAEGAKYGFEPNDFVFDALTLAVSADPDAAKTTLETVRRLNGELCVHTVLGVSNVSFGLPNRPAINNAMYTLAKKAGLSAAIANPSAIGESDDEAAFDVLMGRDSNCARWIERSQRDEETATAPVACGDDLFERLRQSVKRGLKDDSRSTAADLLTSGTPAMTIIENAVIPALEEIGKGFESGKVFLPQLLMSADAAGAAFEKVRGALANTPAAVRKGRPIVIATVKGDIHDIGKNIVRALLENYGFEVIDLGRDVAPETIVEAARNADAMIIALSALMTTTVGAMAETVALARASGLDCRTCVGGAVVTQEYADEIGADFYAKDAMRTVRFAESLLNLD